jgi:hypothetical protein
MLTRTTGILALAVSLGWGCADNSNDADSHVVKAVDVAPNQGVTIDVSSSESAELAGTRLFIPGDALAKNMQITLARQEQSILSGGEAVGPVAVWGPSGTTFKGGATLTLPFHLAAGQSDKDLFVQVLEADNTRKTFSRQQLTVDANAGLVTLTIPGFSKYQTGLCTAASCPSGTASGTGTNGGSGTNAGGSGTTVGGSGTTAGGSGTTVGGSGTASGTGTTAGSGTPSGTGTNGGSGTPSGTGTTGGSASGTGTTAGSATGTGTR